MTLKHELLLFLTLTIALVISPATYAQNAVTASAKPITLLVFESEACEECKAIQADLDSLQQTLSPQHLIIIRNVLEKPESKEAFTQHQVTRLPEYVLLDADNQVLFEMKGTIDPAQLVWEIREQLGLNPRVEIPKPFEPMMSDVLKSDIPVILLFWSWDDPQGQALSQAVLQEGSALFGEVPAIFSFNAQEPEVKVWMQALELSESPAFVVLSPNRTVYQKSQHKAQPWQLVVALRDYAEHFNPELQTILAGLTQPVPVDEYILPATMTLQEQPASDETSPP